MNACVRVHVCVHRPWAWAVGVDHVTIVTPELLATAISFSSLLLYFAAEVMQSEGFGYLEETCPSLLSELLETVAVVDDASQLMLKKRNGSSDIGFHLVDGLDSNGRRMRRRL